MTLNERLTNLQTAIKENNIPTYVDNYFKDMAIPKDWKYMQFHAKTDSYEKNGAVVIGNPQPYIIVYLRDNNGFGGTEVLIGRDVWYPRLQRSATDEEIETALAYFESQIAVSR